ncbi:hypothetical protein PR048_029785 [Dryococelus australis]|uniref:Reverse transcriptase domain-containing protein n=1 Tax=Dryococelus australis TaxID=614101 RepID=A0ABQ9G740_9NEOP|nr:hypothetical protein PR048_029785 [Dryococelus australis]
MQLVRRAKMLYSLDSFGSCRTSGDFCKRLLNLRIVNLNATYSIFDTLKQKDRAVNIRCFRKIMHILLPVITDILNDLLSARFFPTSWKYAIVKPLAKLTSVTVLDDFRPISILPALSKSLESLNNNKLFDSYQSRFLTGHSTCTALIDIADFNRMAIDRSHVTILVLLDFRNQP